MHSSTFRSRYQTAAEEVMADDVMVDHNLPQPKQPHPSWLSRAWKYLLHHLLNGHEPRVWQERNAASETLYCGYDPYTGRSAVFPSDIKLRIWLEQLPHQ